MVCPKGTKPTRKKEAPKPRSEGDPELGPHKQTTRKHDENKLSDSPKQPATTDGSSQKCHTIEGDANTESMSETDTYNVTSSSISITKQAKGRSETVLREVVYVDSKDRKVTAWVSGLMTAATFKRHAKRIIKKCKNSEVVIIDDQTDDTK